MTLMLSENQLKQFDEEGWLFFEEVFDATEVSVLNQEAHRIFAMEREEVFREKDGTTARTAFAAQNYNEAYRRLGRHPRLVEPVKQLLGGDVYMHQFKINAKAAFNGDVWQWHQDFGVWHRDDEMPEPRAMNIALFLEDVTDFTGALMFIPRSHKGGVIKAGPISRRFYTVRSPVIGMTRYPRERGLGMSCRSSIITGSGWRSISFADISTQRRNTPTPSQ